MNLTADNFANAYWALALTHIFVGLALALFAKDYDLKHKSRRFTFNCLIIFLVIYITFFMSAAGFLGLFTLLGTVFGAFCLCFLMAQMETQDLAMFYLYVIAIVIALLVANFVMDFNVI